MATCTQVDHLLQAYIDGELSQAERVIVEQHLGDCGGCTALWQQQQRTSAFMFETLATDRLRHNLRQGILENLPEIDRVPVDVEKVNWRAKHPVSRWAMISRGVPVAVGVALLIVAVVLRSQWPSSQAGDAIVGMVMSTDGKALQHGATNTGVESARVAAVVRGGDVFETSAGSSMMVTLAGPTHIKIAGNSVVKVHDDRRISVPKGRVWLDVSADERFFRVTPPSGEITVLGTQFDVNVLPDRTRVTVLEGQVHVESDRAVGLLTEGQQVDIIVGSGSLVPYAVDAARETRWAATISASVEAYAAYAEQIVPRTQTKILRAKQVFMLLPNAGSASLKSIEVQWNPDGHHQGHCDYQLYITNSRNRFLFKDVIPGTAFDDQQNASYKVLVPEGAIEDFGVLYIWVEPLGTGRVETSFKNTILAETR